MKKIKIKILIPILGISGIAVSSIIAGTSLVIPNFHKESIMKINQQNEAIHFLNYVTSSIIDPNILNNPNELANFLYNYGVFGNYVTNPVSSVDVINKRINDNGCYDVELRINTKNNNHYFVTSPTSVQKYEEIENLNFEKIYNIVNHINTWESAQSFYL